MKPMPRQGPGTLVPCTHAYFDQYDERASGGALPQSRKRCREMRRALIGLARRRAELALPGVKARA